MRAIGFKAEALSGITLGAEQNLTQDLALQQGMVRWSDISMHQGKKLLPDGRGKEELFTHCMACHGFESRMAAVVRDEDGWRDRVAYMKDAMGYFIMRPNFGFNDQKAENVISYINAMFGENSKLPKSPADLPQYQSELRPLSDEALKIVYVEYAHPVPTGCRGARIRTRTGRSGCRTTAAPTRSPTSTR
jgi:cytochrome c5